MSRPFHLKRTNYHVTKNTNCLPANYRGAYGRYLILAVGRVATRLLNGLFAAGKSVPEDFEIITSNDSPITSYTRPNLSSINHPLYDLGAVSMRMLTKIMNKEELEEKDVILNHGITLRQSTK